MKIRVPIVLAAATLASMTAHTLVYVSIQYPSFVPSPPLPTLLLLLLQRESQEPHAHATPTANSSGSGSSSIVVGEAKDKEEYRS